MTSKGLACVGQDEVILLIEVLPDETRVPKDLLLFINQLYLEALKGIIYILQNYTNDCYLLIFLMQKTQFLSWDFRYSKEGIS